MPTRYQIVLVATAFAVAGCVLLGLGFRLHHSPAISVSRVRDIHEFYWLPTTNGGGIVMLMVTNPGPTGLYLGRERIQVRMGGNWCEAQEWDWLYSKRSFSFVSGCSQKEFMAAYVPRGTEAIRLVVAYRYMSCLDYDFSWLVSFGGRVKFLARISDPVGTYVHRCVWDPLNRLRPWRRTVADYVLGAEHGSLMDGPTQRFTEWRPSDAPQQFGSPGGPPSVS